MNSKDISEIAITGRFSSFLKESYYCLLNRGIYRAIIKKKVLWQKYIYIIFKPRKSPVASN